MTGNTLYLYPLILTFSLREKGLPGAIAIREVMSGISSIRQAFYITWNLPYITNTLMG